MCATGSWNLVTGIGLLCIGGLLLSQGIDPLDAGWASFALSLPWTITCLVLPLISLLGSYGVIAASAFAWIVISAGILHVLVGICVINPAIARFLEILRTNDNAALAGPVAGAVAAAAATVGGDPADNNVGPADYIPEAGGAPPGEPPGDLGEEPFNQ